MEPNKDSALLARLAQGGEEAWSLFLTNHADTLFRVIALFTSNYDDRMDMFLFVCSHLKADDMKKLRSFEYRAEAPCRFSTWLTVVVKNLVLDFIRARDGRVRRFRTVESLDESDQLLFDYHISDGRPLEESRQLMAQRHGIQLDPAEAADRAARVHALLSANQRWRLLSRLIEKRAPIPLDPLIDEQDQTPRAAPPSDTSLDPEQRLSATEADRVLRLKQRDEVFVIPRDMRVFAAAEKAP
jgi:DNA-directed RNA polymerase specialized sigma24 family protein